MALIIITLVSVVLQILAVGAALRLIRISRSKTAWILISTAIAGMALRRSITLVTLVIGDSPHRLDLPYELIGLFTSLFMLVGIHYIAPIFVNMNIKEEELRRSETQLRTIIETSHDGICSIDAEGRTQIFNRRMEEMFGYTQEERRGRPISEMIYGDGKAVMAGIIERRKRGVKEHYDLRLVRKDGSDFWAFVSAAPIIGEKDELKGAFAMITDITDRKKLEAEREVMVASLQEALAKVKTLRGLLPICASCKKIRDDKGYWSRIETYIGAHTEAEFSHSICPDCRKKLYSGFGV